ncbi:MAG TPA: hypothetical protein PK129_10540 [Cellvibrionaceae bacterium]|nr:hypothetical protein [Cellvibrionaceae bacterium]
MKKIIILRWLVLIPCVFAAWYAALIVGFLTYQFIEKDLCPKEDLVSGRCHNQIIANILELTMHTFVAISAILVLATAIFIAPFYKKQISYIVFLLGSLVAFFMGYELKEWSLILIAMVAGALTLTIHSMKVFKKA